MNISRGLFYFMGMENKPDIIEVLEKEGIELNQKGRNFWACCPLHSERTESFCVNPEKQFFKCFGCGVGGDVITFIRKYKNLSFKDTLRYLGLSHIKPNYQEIKRKEIVSQFRHWCDSYSRVLCELIKAGNVVDLAVKSPEDLGINGLGEIYLAKEICQYRLSILSDGDDEARFELFKEVMGYE